MTVEITRDVVPPATPGMAAKLSANRTGKLTPDQRRTVLITGLVALAMLLCPLALSVQLAAVMLSGELPVVSFCGLGFTLVGALFIFVFLGLVGTNVMMFLPEAFGKHPVRYARGPLRIHLSETERPELPFSYVVKDYSFAPYVVPPELVLRVNAPYIVYYSARSRLLLSIAALDAPDAAQWEPDPAQHATQHPQKEQHEHRQKRQN